MIDSYKYHSQFILILAVMYVMGVWLDPLIYVVFPVFLLAYGVKGRLFELLIMADRRDGNGPKLKIQL